MGNRPGPGEGSDRELGGTIAFGAGLVAAAGMNFLFSSLMGRMLPPPVFGTLGVLIAALLALIGPVNALSGGTEMFAALHERFPRGRRRLVAPGAGLVVWAACQLVPSTTVRAGGWFALGAAVLVLLAWNRGALVGLGRFGFVGATFVVEGAARVALPVVLVAAGLGLQGASAGLVLGMLAALALTELAVPRVGGGTDEPLGRAVWLALVGLFALGVTQIVDVFAVRVGNPGAAGAYVGAASLARIALFSQMPAAAYALRRSAVEGPRRALRRILALSLGPGVAAIVLIEAAPHLLLRAAYGSRFAGSAGTVRILAVAMLLGGFATVAAQMLMGRGLSGWVWTMAPLAAIGAVFLVTLTHAPTSVALFSLCLQGAALLTVAVPAASLLRGAEDGAPRGVVFLSWRDSRHPQGGGSEVYVEELAARLARQGRPVTIFSAASEGAPRVETAGGVRTVRRGGWRTVYWWAFVYHAAGWLGPHDLLVDVQNGVPFFARLYCRRHVVCLVHHVHRDQWRMNFSPAKARLGWWIESRLAPRLQRGTPYVTVSEATKAELTRLGVPREGIEVVPNGGGPPAAIGRKAPVPTIACLGRLVPHKRIELALDAAAALRAEIPDLRMVVIGRGPWDGRLAAHADRAGVADLVTFTGWLEPDAKHRALSEAWVLAVPSVMEGWGQNVIEAAAAGTPAVAFRVGGLTESIVDRVTGLLAADAAEFRAHLRTVLTNPDLRDRLGAAAAERASRRSWDATAVAFEAAVEASRPGMERGVVLEPVAVAADL